MDDALRGNPARAGFHLVAVAVQFLTRLPVPAIAVDDDDLRRATAVFPLVGVAVGAVTLGVFAAVDVVLGSAVAAVAAVGVAVGVTGAFHEDGLADTFDGLWGGWDPVRRLEIMRDSRLGTYGAAALIVSLGLRIALLAPLSVPMAARAILVGHVLGRAAILVQIRWLPPVSDQGSGARVAGRIGPVGSLIAAVTAAAVAIVALGWWAWVPVATGLVGIAALRRAARRRLGGLTGDVLGATQQVVLVLATAAVVGLGRWLGW